MVIVTFIYVRHRKRKTNVFVKQEPTLWAWEMSMDTRMGAGAARKDGVGIYGVAPAVAGA